MIHIVVIDGSFVSHARLSCLSWPCSPAFCLGSSDARAAGSDLGLKNIRLFCRRFEMVYLIRKLALWILQVILFATLVDVCICLAYLFLRSFDPLV